MGRVASPTWGSFTWGDGTVYGNNGVLPNKYYAPLESADPVLPQRVSVVVKHSNGSLFSLYSILPHVSARAHRLPPYTATVDERVGDRLQLIVKHSNGTAFRLDTIRPRISATKKRLVG